jgi:spermidine/putrescine transport system substrate-binding protein
VSNSPLRALSLAVLSLLPLVAGCGSKTEERKLIIAIWSNYLPDDVLADFEKEFACKAEVRWNYGSNDELLAKLQQGATGFDLAFPSDRLLSVLIGQGLLERLDGASLAGYGHLDPSFSAAGPDPKNEWSVPYTWGTVGIAWRTEKVTAAPDSWAVFGQDGVGGGNAFLLEEGRDVVACAMLLGGRSINSTAAADLAAAKDVLRGWKKNVKGFTGETKDHLLSGEAWMIQAYNGDVAQAMKEMPGKFGFAVPKEGGILWYDNLVIPKGAPSRDLARKFVEFVLRPDVAARISNGIRYAVPNQDALEKVDKAVREDPVIYAPVDVRKRLQSETDLGAEMKKITDLWSEVRAGG